MSRLMYVDKPAWLFTWVLTVDIAPPVGGKGINAASSFVSGKCTWNAIVDATNAEAIESFEDCA